MPKPRKQLISLDATPFYHCYSRCVRRAMLCGEDPVTGRCFDYRRQQIQDDALRLASLFCIDIAALAIMPNHYHLLLHVRKADADRLSAKEVVSRWHSIYSGNPIATKFMNGEVLEPQERDSLNDYVAERRKRLYSISWFMRALNEGVARRANAEDECTGHFWESRFKSTALLDEQSILSCMAHCDLNPIRAGMAETPEESDHTSIQMRIRYWREKAATTVGQADTSTNEPANDRVGNRSTSDVSNQETFQPPELMPFVGNYRNDAPAGLHFNLIDYLELVDWTGRQIREDKRGNIAEGTPPILARLEISPDHWVYLCTHFESRFKGLVGTVESLKELASAFGFERKPNMQNSALLFS